MRKLAVAPFLIIAMLAIPGVSGARPSPRLESWRSPKPADGVDRTQRGLVPTQVLQDGVEARQGGTEAVTRRGVRRLKEASAPGLGL